MISYSFYYNDDRIRRHIANLVSDGWCVDLISLSYPGSAKDESQENVRFFFPRSRSYGRGQLRMLWEYFVFAVMCSFILARNHLFHHRYRLVHVNNMPNFLVFSALGLRLLGVPVLLDIHDTMAEIYQDKFAGAMRSFLVKCLLLEERVSMKLADYVITTEHTKWQRLLTNGLGKSKSDVILNISDPSVWPERELPEAAPTNNGQLRLVYHGTLAWRLGLDLAVRACALLKGRIPNLRLDIIGDGDQRADLIALADELGVNDVVHFSDGFIRVEQLPAVIEGADLAVLPSRDSIATRYMLPGKLLEYVRFGIPAIVVPTPTITYYFGENQVRFFPSEDVPALADAILGLYERPEERLRMAHEARRFGEKYNFANTRARYLAIVNALIEHRTPEVEVDA